MKLYVCSECSGQTGEMKVYGIPEDHIHEPHTCPFIGHEKLYQKEMKEYKEAQKEELHWLEENGFDEDEKSLRENFDFL